MAILVDCYSDSRGKTFTLWRPLGGRDYLLMLANGRERYFVNGGFQPLIDLVTSSFERAMLDCGGPYQERLRMAAVATEDAMAATFPSSRAAWGEEAYSAVFVAVVVTTNQAFAAWIGSPQAQLFRGGRCVETTTPHISVLPSGFVCTSRFLSTETDTPKWAVEVDEPWSTSNDDVLVIADSRLLVQLNTDQIAEVLASEKTSPARALVRRAKGLSAQAALVARISSEQEQGAISKKSGQIIQLRRVEE